jgi:hypothetical protein
MHLINLRGEVECWKLSTFTFSSSFCAHLSTFLSYYSKSLPKPLNLIEMEFLNAFLVEGSSGHKVKSSQTRVFFLPSFFLSTKCHSRIGFSFFLFRGFFCTVYTLTRSFKGFCHDNK